MWYSNLKLLFGEKLSMDNFLMSIRCIIPVLFTLCLGIWFRSLKLVPDELYQHLSTLCFHGLLPFQLFYNVYTAEIGEMFSPSLLLFLEAGVILWFIVNYVVFFFAEPNRKIRGVYIQNSFRSNIAVVGVFLAQTMMDASGAAMMAIAISILVPTYNILAVITLETCRGGHVKPQETVKIIFKNPLIRACVLGLFFLFLGIHLPQPIDQAIKNIGNAGSVMTLIALGTSLRLSGAKQSIRKIIFCNFYRLLVTPFVLVVGASILGFRGNELGVILISAGSPMATTSYPMALACDSDHELTAQVVVTTSLFFCLTMMFWIFVLKQLNFL